MSAEEPTTVPPTETENRERAMVGLAELDRQLEDAEAEGRALQERVRRLRTQIRNEERRLGLSKGLRSSGSLGRTLTFGILAGNGAGVFFLLFNLIMSAVLGNGFLDPLRLTAAIAVGRSVLPLSSPLYGPVIVGLIVHVLLSGFYGAVFAVAARYVEILRQNLMFATTAFGLAIWIVNFFIFSPLFFPWFNRGSPDIVVFIAHTLFFGMPLGAILLEFTPTGGILASNGPGSSLSARLARR